MKTLKHSTSLSKIIFVILFLNHHFIFSQNNFSLEFVNGISLPTENFKDHADNGFNSTFIIHKRFCQNVSASLGTNYSSFALKEELGGSNQTWSATSINIGSAYRIGSPKLFIDLYGKLGPSFMNISEINKTYNNTDIITTNLEKTNTTALNTRVGIKVGIKICEGLLFNLNTEYTSNHQGDIYYHTRDVSKAIDATGNINADEAENIPFEQKSFSFSAMNINFGLVFNLNNSLQSKATSHNASRSNRSNNLASPNDGNDINNGTRASQATDYNSSRSNKADGVNNTDDNNDDTAKATSHNASRSNRSNNVASPDDRNDVNNGTRANEATDYNSSRSNKADGVNNTDDNNDDTAKATSHNASRSNRSNNVASPNDGNDINNGTKATDYNSSRSNKADGVNNTGDNNDDTAKATSHNASRSNRSNNVASPDGNDINNGSRATDYNSSRSNKADGVNNTDDNNNDNEDNNTKATDYNSSRSNRSTSNDVIK